MHHITISVIVVAGIFTGIYFVYFRDSQNDDDPPSTPGERAPLLTKPEDSMRQQPPAVDNNEDDEWDIVDIVDIV